MAVGNGKWASESMAVGNGKNKTAIDPMVGGGKLCRPPCAAPAAGNLSHRPSRTLFLHLSHRPSRTHSSTLRLLPPPFHHKQHKRRHASRHDKSHKVQHRRKCQRLIGIDATSHGQAFGHQKVKTPHRARSRHQHAN